MDERLLRVLEDREKRWNKRQELAAKGGFASLVTITVCLPVAYREDPVYEPLFRSMCEEYTKMLDHQGWAWRHEGFITGEDGPACFIAVQEDPRKVKMFSVEAEQQIPGGRMLDIDLMDSEGVPGGTEALGFHPEDVLSVISRLRYAFPAKFTSLKMSPARRSFFCRKPKNTLVEIRHPFTDEEGRFSIKGKIYLRKGIWLCLPDPFSQTAKTVDFQSCR